MMINHTPRESLGYLTPCEVFKGTFQKGNTMCCILIDLALSETQKNYQKCKRITRKTTRRLQKEKKKKRRRIK